MTPDDPSTVTTPERFENPPVFLPLGLPFKKTKKIIKPAGFLKTPFFLFRVSGKRFENETCRKNDDVRDNRRISLIEFSSNTLNSKITGDCCFITFLWRMMDGRKFDAFSK